MTARKSPATGAAATPRRRVLIVDDHPFMRAGLSQLIERQADLTVCGEAANPAEAQQALAKGGVEVVLADMSMPGRSGLDFIKDLQALHPGLPVLVVSMHDEMVYAERALRAGARGYIMKEAGGESLLTAIRQVLAGQVYVSARIAALLLDSFSGRRSRDSSSPFGKLTDREFEVFQLIGQGRSTQDIARHLGLSPKTVDVHRANLKGKLGLHDATALVRTRSAGSKRREAGPRAVAGNLSPQKGVAGPDCFWCIAPNRDSRRSLGSFPGILPERVRAVTLFDPP